MAGLDGVFSSPPTYQLTCPRCAGWLVEWTPAPGGSVRVRCDRKGCKHHVRYEYGGDQGLRMTILPRDLFSRVSQWFLWLPLPVLSEGQHVVVWEGKRYRVILQSLD